MNDNELKQLFKEYILECKYSKQLRDQTIKSYSEVFNVFQKIMPEIQSPNQIKLNTLNTFYERLNTRKRLIGKQMKQSELKPSTIKTYYRKLIAFFRWLERYDKLEAGFSNSISKPPEPQYTDEKALTDQEVSKIIATITLHTLDDVLVYQRDMLIFNFCIYSGLRRSELLSLRIGDIDLTSRTIFINGKTSKGKKHRYIPLHPQLQHQIDLHLKERKLRGITCEHLIISTTKDEPFTIHGLKHWVERYRKLSGIRFHIHQTRHTFACSLAKSGADIATIMKALGHTTIQMTERYLRSITPEHSRAYIENLSY